MMQIGRWRGRLAWVLLGASFFAPLALPAAAAGASTDVIAAPTRAQVQYFLRRFAFSGPPELVTQVQAEGIPAWLAAQEQPNNIDDSGTELETLPTQLVNGAFPDGNIFERAVVQHMILTRRQLQAKMELHWLDHFAVSLNTVGDPSLMYHYDQTIRANALGNFNTLLQAIAVEPAMLIWLSNNYNSGSTPNENFARESMQLYSFGLYKLNQDGSFVINAKTKLPQPAYSQKDVEAIAKAMTGYGIVYDPNNNDPFTRWSVQYFSGNHYSGAIKYFGKTQPIPTNGTAINYVMNQFALEPSTAPFEAKELLQRFVTENPPAQYVSDIAAVWKKTENDPNQIAEVITAIVNHPDFFSYYNSMPKQPVELVFDSLRQLPGMMQATANVTPGGSLLYRLNSIGQQLFDPPNVFSFYRPGDVETTINTGNLLTRTNVFANLTNAQPSSVYTDTYIDIPTLLARVGSSDGPAISNYLLDAMLDGGSPALQKIIQGFLGKTPDANQISGAIWLLMNAPDYTVN